MKAKLSAAKGAFTLVEMMVAGAIFSAVAAAMFIFSSGAVRMITKNLATNHSHDDVRLATQRMTADLHGSATRFRLMDVSAGVYTDLSTAATADREPLTKRFMSTRANGVRFRLQVAGPCKIAVSTTPTSTSLTFDFQNANGYIPHAGDRIVVPLITRELEIASVTAPPAATGGLGTVSITEPFGYTIETIGTLTTAYFYRRAAYTVSNNQLRFHADFTGASMDNFVVVRNDVTSEKPFSLLYPTAASVQTNGLELRIALESYDLRYSNRRLTNATTVLQAVVPPRNQPPLVTVTN